MIQLPHRRADDAGQREDAEEDALVLRLDAQDGEDIGNAANMLEKIMPASEPRNPGRDQLRHSPGRPTERAGQP